MIILFGKGFKDLDGEEIPDVKGKTATLRGLAIDALLAQYQDEQNLGGEEKLKRWELASKIKNSPDPVEVSAEEVVLIKKLVGKAYGVLVVGQAWKYLEGEKDGVK